MCRLFRYKGKSGEDKALSSELTVRVQQLRGDSRSPPSMDIPGRTARIRNPPTQMIQSIR